MTEGLNSPQMDSDEAIGEREPSIQHTRELQASKSLLQPGAKAGPACDADTREITSSLKS